MTYAERDSIRAVIEGFFATGVVDEVVVVDNNAQPGTAERGRAARGARLVHEPRQGYGHATRRGLDEAHGRPRSCSPSRTARSCPQDIHKLLVYSDECDVVFGTRTTRELIWHGANMDWFLRWGNWAVAKLIEVLFNTSHLSDVGCTYRLLRQGGRRARRGAHDGRRQPRAAPRSCCWRSPRARASSRCRSTTCRASGVSSVTGKPARGASASACSMIAADPALPAPDARAAATRPPRVRRRPARPPATRRVSSSHFDAIADGLRRRRCRRTSSSTTCASGRASCSSTARAGRALDVGCGTGVLAARLAAAGYAMTGVDPSAGMLEVLRARAPDVRARARRRATALPFDDGSFDLVLSVAVMHHIADRRGRAADAGRDGPRRAARRPDPRLGPQPAQPVLGPPDGAGAAGHGRGAADPRGRDARRASRAAGAEIVRADAARAGPGLRAARGAAAPRPRSSGGSSGRRCCAGWAPTTSCSPRSRRTPDRRGRQRTSRCWLQAPHGAVHAQAEPRRAGPRRPEPASPRSAPDRGEPRASATARRSAGCSGCATSPGGRLLDGAGAAARVPRRRPRPGCPRPTGCPRSPPPTSRRGCCAPASCATAACWCAASSTASAALALAAEIDRVFEARGELRGRLAVRRRLLRGVRARGAVRGRRCGRGSSEGGGVLAGDSPSSPSSMLELFEAAGLPRLVERLPRRGSAAVRAQDDTAQGRARPSAAPGTRTARSWATCARSTSGSRCRAAATRRRGSTSSRAGSTRSWSSTRRCSTSSSRARRPRRPRATSRSCGRSSSPATRCSSTRCSSTRPRPTRRLPDPRFAIESWFFGGSAFPADYAPLAL